MEVTGSPWNGYPCPRMLCLDTLQTMDCSVLWSRTRQDVLKMIPPCPAWDQKAAFGLV